MNLTLRALAAAIFVSATAVATLTAWPALAREIGLDGWNDPDPRAVLAAREREARALELSGEMIAQRLSARALAVDDLISSRIDADEAVRRFVELNRADPQVLGIIRDSHLAASDEGSATRQLVSHLRARPNPRARALADGLACRLVNPFARN
jgi:hypothetical protein